MSKAPQSEYEREARDLLTRLIDEVTYSKTYSYLFEQNLRGIATSMEMASRSENALGHEPLGHAADNHRTGESASYAGLNDDDEKDRATKICATWERHPFRVPNFIIPDQLPGDLNLTPGDRRFGSFVDARFIESPPISKAVVSQDDVVQAEVLFVPPFVPGAVQDPARRTLRVRTSELAEEFVIEVGAAKTNGGPAVQDPEPENLMEDSTLINALTKG